MPSSALSVCLLFIVLCLLIHRTLLPFEVGVASSDHCFFNYLFNRAKRKWSWRIKGGARGTGVKYILRGGKEEVMQNWTKQQRSKPPKNLARSHFSVPLFTLKTLSSNRSYLKKPACEINPCRVCRFGERILTSAVLDAETKIRWGSRNNNLPSCCCCCCFLKKKCSNKKKQFTVSSVSHCFCLLVHSLQRPNNLRMHCNTCNYLTINCYLATGSFFQRWGGVGWRV